MQTRRGKTLQKISASASPTKKAAGSKAAKLKAAGVKAARPKPAKPKVSAPKIARPKAAGSKVAAKAVAKTVEGKTAAPATGRTPRANHPPKPAVTEILRGGCHCGAIEYTFATAIPARRWVVHACQCAFCRGHGARTTADPAGEVQFDFTLPEFLRRYRFGLRTADFLVCRECGTYVAAVVLTGRGALANVNVNTLRVLPKDLPAAKAVVRDLESAEERRSRRARTWTPVVGPV